MSPFFFMQFQNNISHGSDSFRTFLIKTMSLKMSETSSRKGGKG